MSKLRGGRIGMREKEGLVQVFITDALQEAASIRKRKLIVYDPVFGYRTTRRTWGLRSGKIEAITSQPPFPISSKRRLPMILDPNMVFPRRPGKLTVANGTDGSRNAAMSSRLFSRDHSRLLVHARHEKLRVLARPREKAQKDQHAQRRRTLVVAIVLRLIEWRAGIAHRWRIAPRRTKNSG